MKLLAGLGNPGFEYERTPHNVGFKIIDALAEELDFSQFQKKFKSLTYKKLIGGEACFFMKPQTYMNKSGVAVAEFANYLEIPVENILVFSDDIDLPPGKARFRREGGHGGHNGLRSIIESLGNSKFPRVRIGVGKPLIRDEVVAHVLSPWSKSDEKFAIDVINLVVKEVICFLETSKFENVSFSVLEKTKGI